MLIPKRHISPRRKLLILIGLISVATCLYQARKALSFTSQSKTQTCFPSKVSATHVLQQGWIKAGILSVLYRTKQPMTRKRGHSIPEELLFRLKTLNKVCSANHVFLQVNARKPVFFRSQSISISYCKVPKAGSSFLGAIVMGIEAANLSQNMFSINRNTIHGHHEVNIHNVSKSDTKVLVTRDPYTRLFSAFIDKYYLLGRLGRTLMKAINVSSYEKDGNTCGYNVTFNQFLDFVAKRALSGMEMNEHLVPVSDLCDACAVKYDIVIRQETLNSDTLYLLSKTNLTIETKMAINAAVSPKGIKNTIHSLITAHLADYDTYREDCPSRMLHTEKVWTSLQIQGYVNKDVAYPKHKFEKLQKYQADNITSIILQGIESHPMTKREKTQQRAMFVRRAYEEVDDETISKIQTVFMKDFIMLNYDLDPPHKRHELYD